MSARPAPPDRLLACGACLAVASLYYIQPVLPLVGAEFGLADRSTGWLPALTQLGYMLGLLFLAPLGDRLNRKRIILSKLAMLLLALLLAAAAPDSATLMSACLAIGLAATVAQDFVPTAADLAPPEARGRLVGRVMTGLLMGILLSRLVSGVLAQTADWRWTFALAAVAVATLMGWTWRRLPDLRPTTTLPYLQLMRSLRALWLEHPPLRLAGWAQSLMSIGFAAFWSSLAVFLNGAPFHLGAAACGAFGLVGIAGALAAPLVGRWIDRHGPEHVLRAACGLAAASFALMFLLPLVPAEARLPLLVVCALGLDLGGQSALVAHQNIVYALDGAARSRLNSVLYCCMFAGIVAGSVLGAWALERWGWSGVVGLALAGMLSGLGLRLVGWVPALRVSRRGQGLALRLALRLA